MTVGFPKASIKGINQKDGLSNLNISNRAVEIGLQYQKSQHKEEIERFISYLLNSKTQYIPQHVSAAQQKAKKLV